jgi:hypothetical protein
LVPMGGNRLRERGHISDGRMTAKRSFHEGCG